MIRHFKATTQINAPVAEAFAWHERPAAFDRLSPPWEEVELKSVKGTIRDGDEKVFQLRMGPIWRTWHARHFGYEKDRQFCDEQVTGPFAAWSHVHRFTEEGPSACRIDDQVEFRLPLDPLSRVAPRSMVEGKLEGLFAYRGAVAKNDIERHHAAGLRPMRILLSGASGLVGKALTAFLECGGHTVVALARSGKPSAERLVWQPRKGFTAEEGRALEGFDAVIHLAGESILGYWTAAKKERIRESRVLGTRHLCEALARLERKPEVLLCASAVGFYGDRGEEELTEDSPPGDSFLAGVAQEWEQATAAASEAGIRTALMRFGAILSPAGGALGAMRLPFSFGVGGRLGSGKQYFAWITLDDVLYGMLHCLATPEVAGPLNFTAPGMATNQELTRTLARVLRRPVGPPAPAFVLRPLLRDLAREVFLSSARAAPSGLTASGFRFAHPELEPALRHLLGRPAA